MRTAKSLKTMFRFHGEYLVIVILYSYLVSVQSMVLPKDTINGTNDSAIDHYVDPDGVKVEKQSVDAVVVGEGFVNETDSRWDYENQDESYFNGDEEEENYEDTKDRHSAQDSNDSTNDNSNSGGGFFNSPTNILDLITSVRKAWGVVEEHRKMWADQAGSAYSKSADDDRLKRNSMSHVNMSMDNTAEQVDSLTPAPLNTETIPTTSVSEARYIKGDPLKGYYDFVITEGSYKFWAAFQLATAALVIYSTFAAIYYSKVNPIVGDYDYVDYLGGGRSLSDANMNMDYVDPSDDVPSKTIDSESSESNQSVESGPSTWSSWSPVNWISTFGKTSKTVLQLIDKLS